MAILVFGDFFVFTNNIRSTRFIIGNLRKEEFVMNKEEAFKAMKEGKKVSHHYFNSKEWMTLTKDGLIEFEDGVVCEQEEFFKFRTSGDWEDGYELFEE